MSNTNKAKLAKKLVKILSNASKVKKSGMNQYAGYQYTTEGDLLELLRPQLVEEGIFIFTSIESVTREGDLTTVITKHTFVDSETGEEFVIQSAGQGADKQDKGIYKAITGASKYMLWKTFLVESNDDPENDNANKSYTSKTPTKAVAKATTTVKAVTKPAVAASSFSSNKTPSKTKTAKTVVSPSSFGAANKTIENKETKATFGSRKFVDDVKEPTF